MSVTSAPAAVAAGHPGAVKVARLGWLAKGVVYLLAGLLAIFVFARSRGWADTPSATDTEASPTGAVKTVADAPGGTVLLVILAIGMFMYALWRIFTVILPGNMDAEGWLTRAGYAASAAMYIVLGWTAIGLTRQPSSSKNGNNQVSDIAVRLMRNTAGRWIIGILGLVLIAAGVYRVIKVVKGDGDDEIDLSGMSTERRTITCRLQQVGDVGRGVAIALIGFFLVRAAATYDANEATGLDGALRRLAATSSGALVVGIIGVGLAAYGVYCLTTFNRRLLKAP